MQGTWNITLLNKDFMGPFGPKIKFYLFKIFEWNILFHVYETLL
jgi:hypothetical protein